jgi:hypothetical protein
MSLHIPPPPQAGWFLNVYQSAGEASGCFVSSLPRPTESTFLPASDPTRSNQEAARRAKGKVRRYCAANGLNRLGTLTYAGEGNHDPKQLRSDLAEFFRSLRSAVDRDLPYLWVPEWHKTDHGLHAHFAVGRYVPVGVIKKAWGRGFVHIKLLSDLPVGSGALAESRMAASYLSKYVSKSFDERRISGLHRYDAAQGFKPAAVRIHGTSELEVIEKAIVHMGAEPIYSWSSRQVEDWAAPPALWMAWA